MRCFACLFPPFHEQAAVTVSGLHRSHRIVSRCGRFHSHLLVNSSRITLVFSTLARTVTGVRTPISVTHPEIAAQLKDRSLGDVLTHGSHKKAWWVCDLKHEYEAKVYSRTSGKGCPYCAGNKVLQGFNDLGTLRPDIACELKDQSLTSQLTVGSHKKVWWLCDLNHEWEATVGSRTSLGRGCPYCAGRKVLAGFNDLGTLRPDVVCELKDQSLASQLTIGTVKKFWWACKCCANEWEATVLSRTSGKGCPSCAKYGFNQTAPSWVYVVSQPSLHSEDTVMVKLGITNLDRLESRLKEHARQGLTEVLALSAYPQGSDALTREVAFKKYLRDLPGEHRVSKDELPDGFSEAFLSTAPEWEAEAFCE